MGDRNSDSLAVAVQELRRTFGDFIAVDNISLSVRKGKSSVFSGRMEPANPRQSGCFVVFSCPQGESALWEDLISIRNLS